MNLEAAKKLYPLEGFPREAAKISLGATAAAEARPSPFSLGERYDHLNVRLEASAGFLPTPAPASGEGSTAPWERTPMVWVGGTEGFGLRFVRMRSTVGSAPASIAAHWYPASDRESSPGQQQGPFAVEYVTALEAADADMGVKPVQEGGDDPRPVEHRLALLEQSLAVYRDAQAAAAA